MTDSANSRRAAALRKAIRGAASRSERLQSGRWTHGFVGTFAAFGVLLASVAGAGVGPPGNVPAGLFFAVLAGFFGALTLGWVALTGWPVISGLASTAYVRLRCRTFRRELDALPARHRTELLADLRDHPGETHRIAVLLLRATRGRADILPAGAPHGAGTELSGLLGVGSERSTRSVEKHEPLVLGRSCPDCEQPLRRIELTGSGYESRGSKHNPFHYAEWGAHARWFSGSPAPLGVVEFWDCPVCGRVLLYTGPLSQPAEVNPAEGPAGSGDEPTAAE